MNDFVMVKNLELNQLIDMNHMGEQFMSTIEETTGEQQRVMDQLPLSQSGASNGIRSKFTKLIEDSQIDSSTVPQKTFVD